MSQPPQPVALITGAARRIGAATAKMLANRGYRVMIHYNRSQHAANLLATEINQQADCTSPHSQALRHGTAATCQGDLSSQTALESICQTTLDTFGRCDLLINNASSFYPTPIGHTSEAQWNDLFASNLKAPFFLSQRLAGELTRHHGAIINIADIHGERPLKDHTVYCMAKSGNVMLTKSLAKELAPHVRVNGIAPGAILWPEDENQNAVPNPDHLQRIPLRKVGGTESITKAIEFLVFDAQFVTGQIINIDGGRTLLQ